MKSKAQAAQEFEDRRESQDVEQRLDDLETNKEVELELDSLRSETEAREAEQETA
jgi:hypothetical protein